MDGDNENQKQQPPRRRKRRGPTMLPNDQKYNPMNAIEFDDLGQSIGRKQTRFSSWIGIQARTRLSILESDWHQIDEDDKEQLWQRVKAHFNITDDTRREFVIKIANGCWKSFKKRLISNYVAKGLDATNVYSFILEEVWEKFKGLKSTTEFLERSRINRENSLKNKNPARVGPRGYRGMKVDWEKQTGNYNELKSLLDGIQDTRARNWVHARIATDESGSKVLPATIKPIVDEIIEYDRKKSQGSWIPPAGVDPLIQVLGPEHSGRTRAVGYLVGLKKGLQGVQNKKRSSSKKEALAEIPGTYVPNQISDESKSGQMSSIPVESSKMKKSSSSSPHFDPLDLSEALPCYLLVPYGKMMRCARGMVYPLGDGLIHGVPLEDGHLRVAVDVVYPKYDALPLPMENENAEMHVLGDARHAIIQWPREAIILVKDYQEEPANPELSVQAGASAGESIQPSPMTTSTDAKKKMAIKIPHNWRLHANTIKDKSFTVKQFFKRLIAKSEDGSPIHIVAGSGIFEAQSYEFNIELDDMVRLISGRWLDISIIAWFQIMLHSSAQQRPNNKQSAFLNPYCIQEKSCVLDSEGVTDYIVRAMTYHHDKKLLVAPYWEREHWVLFVIDRHRRMGYIMDSWLQGGKTKNDFKVTKLVERAVSRYTDCVDSDGRMGWTMVECNQQNGGWECGYYVLRWLFAIVVQGPGILLKKDSSCISSIELDKVVNTWVNKFVALDYLPQLP